MEDREAEEAKKAITVNKAAIAQYNKDIEKIKATISVYNELYVQTSMEYYTLANAVGVQLESERDGTISEAQSSHPSSGFISARRRYHENLTAQVGKEI